MGKDRNEGARSRQVQAGAANGFQGSGWARRPRGPAGSYGRVREIGTILDAITIAGDGITISRTQSGDACAVTLFTTRGGQRVQEKEYPHSQEELDDLFESFREFYLPV